MIFPLAHSLKDSETFKCDKPENTIKRIEKSFEQLGFKLVFTSQKASRDINLYFGRAEIPSLGIGSNGKGLSPELTKASALAELVERISSGLFFRKSNHLMNLPFKGEVYSSLLSDLNDLSNFNFLDGYIFSHEDDLLNTLSCEELLSSNYTLFTSEIIQQIKQDNICQHWVNGYSLLREENIKIPLKLIQHISGSNGLAAGNTLEEAIVQASNEVFERYACITALRAEKILPTIDISTIPYESVQRIIRFFQKKNISIFIKDFSLGGVFPCFGVLFINKNIIDTKNPLKKAFLYRNFRVGSSFHAEEALLRCFTEQLQGKSITYHIKKNNLDFLWDNFLKHFSPTFKPIIDYMTVFRKYFFSGDLSFLEKGEIIPFSSNELLFDCYEEIERIKDICKNLATDFLVVDHTHSSFNFPVVRVVIPKMSDILPYLNYQQQDFVKYLINITPNNIYTDVDIDERYYIQNNWMTDERALRDLANTLIDAIKKTTSLTYSSSVLLLNELHIVQLLASIYYQLQDLSLYSLCTRMLSKLYPKQRRCFIYLSLLAKYNQTELLAMEKEKLSESNLFFQTSPPKNPFLYWCNSPDAKISENERITNVRRLIDIFLPSRYVNREQLI